MGKSKRPEELRAGSGQGWLTTPMKLRPHLRIIYAEDAECRPKECQACLRQDFEILAALRLFIVKTQQLPQPCPRLLHTMQTH
jgi:hypothetical protein